MEFLSASLFTKLQPTVSLLDDVAHDNIVDFYLEGEQLFSRHRLPVPPVGRFQELELTEGVERSGHLRLGDVQRVGDRRRRHRLAGLSTECDHLYQHGVC
jgi:hypothetical protein